MEKETLKIGDKVYELDGDVIVAVHVITRVTDTQAKTENGVIFQREYEEEVKRLGKPKYSRLTSYYFGTMELRKKLMRQNLIAKVRKMDFSKLSYEDLETIWRMGEISKNQ